MPPKEGYITRQARRLHAGEINRRRFIMSALGAGVTLPTAMSLASRAEAGVPKRGGRLRYGTGFGTVADRLDPGLAVNQMTTSMAFARGNCLTEVSRSGGLVPELAERFEVSEDGRTWIFDLRRGVEFHDGKSLTADDVVATYQHHRRGPSTARTLFTEVADIRAEGPVRVVIELKWPNAEFPWRLADPRLVVLPSDAGRVDPQNSAGTGGYILTGFEPGRRAEFRHNPNYWKPGAAHFDAVEIVSLRDTGLRQNAAMVGDVDVIDAVDPRAAALLARVPTLDILDVPGRQHFALPMRLADAPFDNLDLRLALKYAIRRDELVERVLLGRGSVGNDVPVRCAHGCEEVGHDPERAAFHYRRSGHSGPLGLALADETFPGAVEAAKLVAASARAAGIEVDLIRDETGASAWSLAIGSERPTLDLAALDADLQADLARAETDPERRAALYGDLFQRRQRAAHLIVPMWANDIHAHSRTLSHDAKVGRDRIGDGGRLTERWWFA